MKISLRALLLWVTFAALVAAALARPSLLWTRLVFTCTIVFLVWAVIGALATRGNQRVFWIGAAAFGLAYGAMFSGGRPSPYGVDAGFEMGRVLVTQHLLDWAARAIGHDDVMQSNRATVWDPTILWQPPSNAPPPTINWIPSYAPVAPQTSYLPYYDPGPQTITPQPRDPLIAENAVEVSPDAEGDGGIPPPSSLDLVPSLTPPTTTYAPVPYPATAYTTYPMPGGTTPGLYGQFLLSGHCAFLILIAVIGGVLARWCFGSDAVHSAGAAASEAGQGQI